jgi:Cys-tRNA(Pro) deacylase
MAKHKQTVTAAVRALRRAGVPFQDHPYDYVEGGGTARFAAEAGVDEHLVLKTLVMEVERGKPLLVLMHGDCQVSTRALARQIGAKSIRPCKPTTEKYSGYQVGGTSPFGTRRPMPLYCEESIATLRRIYVNRGRRGVTTHPLSHSLSGIAPPSDCN